MTVASLLIGQTPAPLSPADAVAQAHADVVRLPNSIRATTRYLSLYNLPAADRAPAAKLLAGHCNGLSREPDLTVPTVIAGGAMLRVNLADYGWSRETWEKLIDPYFTATIETTVEVPWAGGVWPGDGKFYAANTFTVKRTKKTQALAPWLTETPAAQTILGELVAQTQSKMPVVRADWFFQQTAAAADRSPNYYDFLALKTEKDFQRLAGVDVKLAEERKSVHREAVAISGVTLKSRAILRLGAIDGGYWKTLDFTDNNDKKNTLRVLGKDIEAAFDATEQIASLPNGMLTYFLANNKGEAQATAPDKIASDGVSRSNDRRVHANVSCIRCHANGGLQDVDGWVKNLLSAPLDLKSPDYDRARALRREYSRDLQAKVAQDRAGYETAIKEASGLDSKAYSAAYAAFWERYEDATIDLERAAAELGTTTARFAAALDAKVKANTADTVLPVLLLRNPRTNRIPVRIWEELYPEAHLILRGYQQ